MFDFFGKTAKLRKKQTTDCYHKISESPGPGHFSPPISEKI